MSASAHPRAGSGGGLPVLGALSPFARTAVLATLVASVIAIVLDFAIHAPGTVVFVVAAVAISGSPGSSASARSDWERSPGPRWAES